MILIGYVYAPIQYFDPGCTVHCVRRVDCPFCNPHEFLILYRYNQNAKKKFSQSHYDLSFFIRSTQLKTLVNCRLDSRINDVIDEGNFDDNTSIRMMCGRTIEPLLSDHYNSF